MTKMARPITLREIAQQLQIHVSTVSRVLNGSEEDAAGAASAESVLRIRRLATELGYRPNPHATSLKTQRSQTIGVLVPNLCDLVLATIYGGIDAAAAELRIQSFVANTLDVPTRQRELGEMALGRRVDGLIIGDAHIDSDGEFLDELNRRGVPLVLVSRRAGNYCSVTCDDYLGGRLVAEHFIQQGHRDIAVLMGEAFASTGRDRSAGFLECLAEHGIDVPQKWKLCSAFDSEAGREKGEELFSGSTCPTAVFAVNDFLAIGLMGAARDHRLIPGKDIAIVGFNDTSLAAHLPIALSSVRSPMHRMGYRAMQLLYLKIKGKAVESERLAPELIIRTSSATRLSA